MHPQEQRGNSTQQRHWRDIATWTLQGALALLFAAAGGAKLAGVPTMVQVFERIGIGQWFRILTGTLELFGAGLLLAPMLASVGAGLLACIMIGAVFANVVVIGGNPMPAVILLIGTLVVAWLRKNDAALGPWSPSH